MNSLTENHIVQKSQHSLCLILHQTHHVPLRLKRSIIPMTPELHIVQKSQPVSYSSPNASRPPTSQKVHHTNDARTPYCAEITAQSASFPPNSSRPPTSQKVHHTNDARTSYCAEITAQSASFPPNSSRPPTSQKVHHTKGQVAANPQARRPEALESR
jgi:hypothetical protein